MLEDGSGKILAGGMSLIPLMKLRLASPESVIDLRRVPGLKEITESGGVVRVGAMATHHEVEGSPVIRGKCPLLGEAAGQIGDTQVRNVGTIGGSVAHADPSADYPAALVALEARIRLRSAQGERVVEASEFFVDAFTTAMEPGEIVVAVEIAAEEASEGYKYEKVAHPASGFPVVGVAVRVKRGRRRDCAGAHRGDRHGRARLPRAQCGGAAGRRRGRGSGGGGGGRGRGGQLRPLRLGRVPAPSGAGARGARASRRR